MVFVFKKHFLAYIAVFVAAVAVVNGLFFSSSQTSAPAVINRVVIIDAGHGGEDGGAVSPKGVAEKDITLQVATKLQALLEQSGCTVFMTRTQDISIHDRGEEKKGNRKVSDLDNRRAMADKMKADAFVSIHINLFPQPQYYGAQTFYASNPANSQNLAAILQQELKNGIDNNNNREIKEAKNNIYILRNTKVPSVVVECGFLSNPREADLLVTPEYQQQLAFCVYSGILKFFASE